MTGSPSVASLFARRIVVGVAEYAVANDVNLTLSTYALGSCVGVVAYDPEVRAAGILHLMLPASSLAPEKAARQPAMFADTGVPQLFAALSGLRAQRTRLRLYIAGGAAVLAGPDNFKIGERNIAEVRKLVAACGYRVVGTDTGGTLNRTLHLEIGTGRLTLKLPDRTFDVGLG